MKIRWVMNIGHDFDMIGEDLGEEAGCLCIGRPALVSYTGGNYELTASFVPFDTANMAQEGMVVRVPKNNVLFLVDMDSEKHGEEPIIKRYLRYLKG
ncbi:MAG: hypothetical protein ACI4P0_02850 [Mailhella sp.]